MTRTLLLALLLGACSDVHDVGDAFVTPDAAVPRLHCMPEAMPSSGFVQNEVYIEAGGALSCSTRVCIVFHLVGAPGCVVGDPRCSGPETNACFSGESLCLEADTPDLQTERTSPDRTFCSCRCGAAGNASLPLCTCPDAWRCVPDTDPGGGYCVPQALAIAEGLCETSEECASGTACDATGHCR